MDFFAGFVGGLLTYVMVNHFPTIDSLWFRHLRDKRRPLHTLYCPYCKPRLDIIQRTQEFQRGKR